MNRTFFNSDFKSRYITISDRNVVPDILDNTLYHYNSNIWWGDINISNSIIHLSRRMPLNADSETANLYIADYDGNGLIQNTYGELNIKSNVNVSNAIVLSSNGGVAETISLTNIQGTSAESIYVRSNVGGIKLDAGSGGISMNKLVIGVQQMTTTASTIISPTAISLTESVLSFELSNSAANYYTFNYGVSNSSGQLIHIFYTNTLSGSARIDFGANRLYCGSGKAQYITFQNTGEAATLINVDTFVNNVGWRVINTGALVS